ncbi:hypothetical protein PI124_g7818 [Phytophthora idaei]|nr:hypothetical protein PI126_g19520 [Phytophthora idaei]KAG3247476.1 hypothetical protein PI124_g7818 [Phytophthora idaei]
MAFQARWRKLKKLEWQSKRPTVLSNDHTYFKPGKTKKDTPNVDFFVGAEALLTYLDSLDLAEMEREKTKKRDAYSQPSSR